MASSPTAPTSDRGGSTWSNVFRAIGVIADVAAVVALLIGKGDTLVIVAAVLAALIGSLLILTSKGRLATTLGLVITLAGASIAGYTFSLSNASPQLGARATETVTITVAAPPSSGGRSPTPTTSPVEAVFRETGERPITLSDQFAINLDSREPDWEHDRNPSGLDLGYNTRKLYAPKGLRPLASPVATLADCQEATGTTPGGVPEEQLREGTTYCTETSEGRFAKVVVKRRQVDPLAVVLDVVVWE